MTNVITHAKTYLRRWLCAAMALTVSMNTALATGIGDSKIATGTQELLGDLTTWLLVLAPIAGVACVIFFAIRRSMADEQEQKQWNNRIIASIVSVAIAILASVIIKLVTTYYG